MRVTDGDPALDFGMDFIDMWKKTENYRIFQKFTGKRSIHGGITEIISNKLS